LRAHTAQAHRALECTPLMDAVAAGLPDKATYGAYLAAQWQLHEPLESALAPWLSAEQAALRLVKTAWLTHDLRALGHALPPTVAAVQVPRSWSQALGVLYVLEGATLGLQMVRRQLPASHPGRGTAGRFFQAYGERTGPLWAGFLRLLEELEPAAWASACDAAQGAFESFLTVFNQALNSQVPAARA
jgi:heme oxygenase